MLFVSPEDHKTEPLLPFPLRHIYRERLRLGAPELLRRLQELGYEVWIYTSSERYIRGYFRCYGVKLDGVVNAQRHRLEVQRGRKTPLPQKVPSFYRISLHVDDESVVVSWSKQFGYTVYQLDAQDDDWVEKIIVCAEKVRKKEEMTRK